MTVSQVWPDGREFRALCRLLPWQAPLPRFRRADLVGVSCLSALVAPNRTDAGAARAVECRIEAWRERRRGSLVLFHDDAYPPLLREIARPPLGLFVEGDVGALHGEVLAVVGARAASAAYRDWTRDTAAALARAGIVIGSGLARGIDAAAHRGALEASGTTIAVVGAGCDVCYPPENAPLQSAITRQGCVTSELLPGTPPRPWHFPSRNRILAGIARGVLVVQAEHKSGALITARLALHENRDVLAVPGDVQDPRSRGPHALLRQGAALVESVGDVMRELGWQPGSAPDTQPDTPAAEQAAVLAALAAPLAIDALRARLGWEPARLQRALAELELLGIVQRDAGGRIRPATT